MVNLLFGNGESAHRVLWAWWICFEHSQFAFWEWWWICGILEHSDILGTVKHKYFDHNIHFFFLASIQSFTNNYFVLLAWNFTYVQHNYDKFRTHTLCVAGYYYVEYNWIQQRICLDSSEKILQTLQLPWKQT